MGAKWKYESYRNAHRNRDDDYRNTDNFYTDKGENLSESRKLSSDYVVIDRFIASQAFRHG
jgi:hypothetical protein